MTNLKISILSIAYNHEKFIRDAIESFIMQKTDFDFEVIIGDDCSTDDTSGIIKEFEQKYPHIIKPIYRDNNIGMMRNLTEILYRANGEYIALCEGDDYWVDPYKLQKQVDFLDAHDDYILCAGKSFKKENGLLHESPFPQTGKITFQDIAHNNFLITNTVVFRNIFREDESSVITGYLQKALIGDIFLFLALLMKGKGYILSDYLGVRTMRDDGAFSNQPDKVKCLYSFATKNVFLDYLKDIKADEKYIKDVECGYIFRLNHYLESNSFEVEFLDLVPAHIMNKALNAIISHFKFQNMKSGPSDYFSQLLAQREAARAELAAIKHSTSWRLTYPVRLAGGIIKDVLALTMKIFKQIKNKKSLLVIDDRIPDPTLGYGYPRTYNILRLLADLGYKVTFFPLRLPDKIEPYTSLLQQKGIEIICNPQNTKLDFEIFFQNKKYFYDAIWISRPHNMRNIAGIIKRVFPSQKIVYDAEALFSSRKILKSEIRGNILPDQEKEKMINEEINLMRQADAVVTVSKAEKNMIKKHYGKKVSVLGNCYDIKPTRKPFNKREGILFVGSFLDSTTPNEDAVHYFVDQLYPDIYKATSAKFFVVGTNYSESVKKLASENIIITGKVDDLYDYFNNCRVFVVPTRYSSGISLKLLESLSFGLPAVVTPLIANQLDIDEYTVLIGKNNDELIEKTIKCYKDNATWQSLREAGLKYIGEECSSLAYKKKLNDIVQAIIN